VTYTPTIEGDYKVIVKFANQEVTKSPFNVYVEGQAGDPNKCRAHGPGIEPTGVVVDKPTFFEIDTSAAGKGPIEVIILDPSPAHKHLPINLIPLGNGRYRCDYVAKEPGLHSVNVFFAGKPIPNSPYGVNVTPSNF
jgi:filamin